MNRFRSVALAIALGVSGCALAACGDTGDHFGEFRQQISNSTTVTSVSMSFPIKPSRTANQGNYVLYVNANNSLGNPINGTWSQPVTLTTSSSCEVEFFFYVPGGGNVTLEQSITFNAEPGTTSTIPSIGIAFNPTCGPNPVTITASADGVKNSTISF